jgi:hypothetical protein
MNQPTRDATSFNLQPGSAGVIEPDPAPAPSANEFTIAWIAYACF